MKINKDMMTYAKWKECCQDVLDNCEDPTARAYATAGLTLHVPYPNDLGEAVKAQAVYLRGNLGEWHGEQARICKRWIDKFMKWGLTEKKVPGSRRSSGKEKRHERPKGHDES